MMISMVAAAGINHGIGKNNQLLWHLPEDLKYFKKITSGHPVVMGRKTFESVGRPLPGRRNVVISRDQNLQIAGCEVVHSVDETLELLREMPEIMIVGGADVYRLFMPLAHRIYLTRVYASPEADTFFPEIDPAQWMLIRQENYSADAKHAYGFSFEIWERLDSKSGK